MKSESATNRISVSYKTARKEALNWTSKGR